MIGGGICKDDVPFHTVDGRNPAPVDMVNIPLFTGFYTSQVVGNGISEPSTVVGMTRFSPQKRETETFPPLTEGSKPGGARITS